MTVMMGKQTIILGYILTRAATAASNASLSFIFTNVLACGAPVVPPNVVISSPFKYVTVRVESFLQFHR